MRASLVFGCVALVIACTPARLREPVGSTHHQSVARVCVLRPERDAVSMVVEIKDNGQPVGATRGASYFCYLAAPGQHQITSDDETGPLLFTARAGARYWLHQEVTSFDGDLRAHLDWVDELVALEMLDACDTRVLLTAAGPEQHDEQEGILPVVAAAPR